MQVNFLAMVFGGIFSVFTIIQSGLDQVTINGTLQAETVHFTIANDDSSPIRLSYHIIIQDNILERSPGDITLSSGAAIMLSVPRSNEGVCSYQLIVIEKSPSGATLSSKVLVLVG